MKSVFRFMASNTFRVLKAVSGLYLIILGVFYPESNGLALALVGGMMLLAGLMDFCLLAPLFGYPFLGDDLRKAVSEKKVVKAKAKKKKKK